MKRKIPEVQKALTVYVDMFARAAEVDREQLQDFLDGYWLLRRLSEYEDAAPAPSLEIRPVSPPEELIRAVRDEPKNPVEELIEQAAEKKTTEGMEPVKKKPPDRGTGAAKFKRTVRDRIEELRRENVSLQSLADASRGVTLNQILDILQGAKVDYSVYVVLAEALAKFSG
ncbi:MAG: hypothetical protein IKS25_07525 [Oscillospiraceae bacterium]|nr:hypothetical protein [Oscillospiraceae bacterium]